jgi:hypothetical protein
MMKKGLLKLANEISLMRIQMHHLANQCQSLHDKELVQYSQMLDEKLNAFQLMLRTSKQARRQRLRHII